MAVQKEGESDADYNKRVDEARAQINQKVLVLGHAMLQVRCLCGACHGAGKVLVRCMPCCVLHAVYCRYDLQVQGHTVLQARLVFCGVMHSACSLLWCGNWPRERMLLAHAEVQGNKGML